MNPFAPIDRSPWRVAQFTRDRVLLWRNRMAGTWVWVLRHTTSGGTRLVCRIRIAYTRPSGPAFAAILELADFPMFRRMLLGIKERAEALATKDSRQGSHPDPPTAPDSKRTSPN